MKKSSNIKDIQYLENQTLKVEFLTGSTYKYHNVPVELYTQLINSESLGSFFYNNIKGKFKTEKVNNDE